MTTTIEIPSRNLINGEWTQTQNAETFEVKNPATDETITAVPVATPEQVRSAIDAAAAAQPAWAARPAAERAKVVRRLAELMARDADRLAELMTIEQGKPLAEAKGEINYALSFLEYAAEEARRLEGDILPASAADKRILVLREPVGVCAIITPWNFPSAMITRKLGPALAAGCAAIIKPAEDTPLSALAIGELAIEAGVPAGCVNIITGKPAAISEVLFDDPRVRKLSFTGSTPVGRILMQAASKNLMRISLELGGHAPFIVFDDADMDRAVEAAIACKFRNAGQTCISANRFYIHESIFDDFNSRFADAMQSLKVGYGLDESVKIGPLINDAAIQKVESHVEDAKAHGATILTGGNRVRPDGFADRFYAPTLIAGFTPAMKLSCEETFGPVAATAPFKTEEEAIRLANQSEYGLAAYYFTRDAARLMRVAEALEYGIIGANDAAPSTAQAPFGGVKHSGLGREGGKYVMDEYTELKYVSWRL